MTQKMTSASHCRVAGSGSLDTLETMKNGIVAPIIEDKEISMCARGSNPGKEAEDLARKRGEAVLGGMRAEAGRIRAEYQDRLETQQKRTNVSEAAGHVLAGHHRYQIKNAVEQEWAPTVRDRILAWILEVFSIIALAGALMTTANAMRMFNVALYDTNLFSRLIMATPLVLAAKVLVALSLTNIQPERLDRLSRLAALTGIICFVIWLLALAAQSSIDANSTRAYGSVLSPASFKAMLNAVRLATQIATEVSFAMLASYAAHALHMRGRVMTVWVNEAAGAYWVDADANTATEEGLVEVIAAATAVIDVIDKTIEDLVASTRRRVEQLVRDATQAAENAYAGALAAKPPDNPHPQLRLI